MEKLNQYGLVSVIKEIADSKKPFLGICLGLQLLFESSEESAGVQGLGILPGKILRIPDLLRIKDSPYGMEFPVDCKGEPLFSGIRNGVYVYSVHSYYCKAEEESIVAALPEQRSHSRFNRAGQCIRLPVPSGKKRQHRPSDFK